MAPIRLIKALLPHKFSFPAICAMGFAAVLLIGMAVPFSFAMDSEGLHRIPADNVEKVNCNYLILDGCTRILSFAGRPARSEVRDFTVFPTASLSKTIRDHPGQQSLDWARLRRDTPHITRHQIASAVMRYSLPEDVTTRTAADNRYGFGKWMDRSRTIRPDNASPFLNYMQDPYGRAGYYVRASEHGFTSWNSLFYSAMMSALNEFAIEDSFERPSIRDLIATPIIGSLAGNYFMSVRERIMAKDKFNSYDKLFLAVTAPLGALNNLVDRLLGIGPEGKMHCNLLLAKGTGLEKTPDNSVQKSPIKTGSSPVFGLRISVNWP